MFWFITLPYSKFITSKAAPAIFLFFNISMSACSSIRSPREALIRKLFFLRFIRTFRYYFFIFSLLGICIVNMSDIFANS